MKGMLLSFHMRAINHLLDRKLSNLVLLVVN